MTPIERAKSELVAVLHGCSCCEYDEADGVLMNHCDKCCREVTAASWKFMALALAAEVNPPRSRHTK